MLKLIASALAVITASLSIAALAYANPTHVEAEHSEVSNVELLGLDVSEPREMLTFDRNGVQLVKETVIVAAPPRKLVWTCTATRSLESDATATVKECTYQ